MRKFLLLVWILPFIVCQPMLLKKDTIAQLEFPSSDENLIIYYTKTATYSKDGKLFIRTHRLLKASSELRTAPELLYVFDTSVEKLKKYKARILHRDGGKSSFSLGDLHTISLSSADLISEAKVKILPVIEEIKPGDIIETVAVHEHTLPQLGLVFSPFEVGATANNISLKFILPPSDSLYYKVYNCSLAPDIYEDDKNKIYTFNWKHYKRSAKRSVFTYKNTYPLILAAKSFQLNKTKQPTWKDFGNWYLDLIAHRLISSPEIEKKAKEITDGIENEKQKMDAIFEYVQKNIRYEQVYLEKGGFIPNDPHLIFSQKYGDCKDYSVLTHVMAKSVGLSSQLALCFRGRGYEFFPDLPVSQFNHAILHFKHQGRHYWYDGTNRSGLPGITTPDLINQKALVLGRDESSLIMIDEFPDNRIKITGKCTQNEKSLNADLKIELMSQYAIKFFFLDNYLNHTDMNENIIRWIRAALNQNMVVNNLNCEKHKDRFIINIMAEIPNSVVTMDPYSYVKLGSVLSELLPDVALEKLADGKLNYFPGYNRITTNLLFPDLIFTDLRTEQENHEDFKITFSCDLPSGPFSASEKKEILEHYPKLQSELKQNFKLIAKEKN